MRAKKFGVTALSSDVKKIVRAERFGLNNSNTVSIGAKVVNIAINFTPFE